MKTNNSNILNYRIIGNGCPVIFLHGFLECNTMWNNLIPHLKNMRIYAIELPGHGKSRLTSTTLSLPKIALAVHETIQHLGLTHFSILGHSLGGYVALSLAKIQTEGIENIVLLNSHPWADSESKKKDRDRAAKVVAYNKNLFLKEAIPKLYYQPHLFETKINALIEEAYEMDNLAIIQTLMAMRDRGNCLDVLKNGKHKITIIQGEYDTLIPINKTLQMAEETQTPIHVIEGIGHMAHHEATQQLAKILNRIFELHAR
ncbi:hypothetical protein CW751_12965 [Brumimicrobium salinarum]|uniref:AB hydrolase-1 domain-containing protein n=1 Tax=Brumimicrobium salinarum TaxID=2058658 RepID=A0A2I0R0E5_9FLAO|nr:alpha/beta fold hydrolase [Brumimicrobium salinarum]PKR79860.1 hypothetical protein CW751_12965 [Brumimicrobium salinarum]